MLQCKKFRWLLIAFLLCTTPAHGGEKITIATAINFINPMTEISASFQSQHDIRIEVSYGSSGKLFAQMQHGAPYDLFLSADQKRPQLLHDKGLCEEPFQYASGAIVLWQAKPKTDAPSWQEALQNHQGKVAIASPEAAPYGEKAYKALSKVNLLQQIKPQLIYGQSLGQAFLFTATGSAKLGFIALSQALSETGKKGCHWPIPEAEPVEQWGCIATRSKAVKSVQQFKDFLLSKTGARIRQQYGYQ